VEKQRNTVFYAKKCLTFDLFCYIMVIESEILNMQDIELKVTLNTLIEKLGNPSGTKFEDLSASDQAHIEGYQDQFDPENPDIENGQCYCGEYGCKDAYVHATSGW